MKWFSTKVITSRDGTKKYLTRRYIIGHEEANFALMLHQMHNPDDDACHHDHPWSFITLVLKGGYIEQITNGEGSISTRRNSPGTLLYRPATHTHRIDRLPSGSCWTLVMRFRRQRKWGFWTKEGWVHWKEFIEKRVEKGILWCGGGDDVSSK